MVRRILQRKVDWIFCFCLCLWGWLADEDRESCNLVDGFVGCEYG